MPAIYGGLITQDFAICYLGTVLGVLLIDSTSINIERIDEVDHSDEMTSDDYGYRSMKLVRV
ncbi:hypothetical protein GNK04_12315 [Bacillus sp. N1-1]|nr:hypothetical protein GNK04_12315 [Bacillus sp. N1-1]